MKTKRHIELLVQSGPMGYLIQIIEQTHEKDGFSPALNGKLRPYQFKAKNGITLVSDLSPGFYIESDEFHVRGVNSFANYYILQIPNRGIFLRIIEAVNEYNAYGGDCETSSDNEVTCWKVG